MYKRADAGIGWDNTEREHAIKVIYSQNTLHRAVIFLRDDGLFGLREDKFFASKTIPEYDADIRGHWTVINTFSSIYATPEIAETEAHATLNWLEATEP
ncbi:MAG: hypothetical protein PW792_09680 [Acidobacteriaceae bacterium]|nr:hypothetical protein [Acidobacteriaceae bacterium]